METEVQLSKQNLIDKLEQQARKFDYYQAIKFIKNIYAQEKDKKGQIHFHPKLSLAHPESDILDIVLKDNIVDITTTFLSLYGTSSPLPNFYTESIIEDEQLDRAEIKALLDVFHQHLNEILFEIWSKSQVFNQFFEHNNKKAQQALLATAGLTIDEPTEDELENLNLLRYASHFASARSTESGLEDILNDYFEVPCDVLPFHPSIQNIPADQRCVLGKKNNCLTDNAYLGQTFNSCNNNIKIQIGPVNSEQFNKFLSHGEYSIELEKKILNYYVKEPLGFYIEVILDKSSFKPAQLSSKLHGQLGISSWLYPLENIDMYTIRYWLLNRESREEIMLFDT